MADRDGLRLDGEAGHRAASPFRDHVVEQHRVQPADHQVAERMHIVLVRDDLEVLAGGRLQQDLVGDGAGQRADRLAAQVRERSRARRVRVADAQHFAELVVRQRDRERGAARGRVFDAAHADIGVAAGDALVD